MTAVQDRPRADAGARRRAEQPKSSRTARMRVSVRIARRQVRRTWVSSLLIMALIALPIAGMAGVAVFVSSTFSTAAERVDVELGRMEAWVAPLGTADAGFWQVPTDPYSSGYGSSWATGQEQITAVDPASALPAGTEIVKVSEGRERIATATGIAAVPAWAGDVGDPRFAGRFEVTSGSAPKAADEVMVTPATLERVGVSLGGRLELVDSAETVTIVGTFDDATRPDADSAVAFADADRFEEAKWYLPETPVSWSQIQALNMDGLGVYSREVVLDPPSFTYPDGSEPWTAETGATQGLLALASALAAGGLAAGYMVVMLAGAAFAVSARRQQRALAIAASVGAEPRDLRSVVLLQGTVLGLVGGLIGMLAGIGLAAMVMQIADNGSATQFWGFHVPWALLVGILVFAMLVGTASAFVPARSVGRSDTISALRGARRPQRVGASRPLWGSLLILIGATVTVLCGLAAAAVATDISLAWDSPLRWLPTIGIIAGPVLAQVGILISGRWLLWLASRLLSRLGIAARIAARDAVANGARTVPAFAAIGATVFVGVFAVGLGMMAAGQSERTYSYTAPLGSAYADISSMTETPLTADEVASATGEIESALRTSGATETALVQRQTAVWAENENDIPADAERAVAVTPASFLIGQNDLEGGWTHFGDPSNNLQIIAPDDLPIVMGISLSASDRAAYLDGAALVADERLIVEGAIEVASWPERAWRSGRVPDNAYVPASGQDLDEPSWRRQVPAIGIDAREQGVAVAIAPATAKEWGLRVAVSGVYAAFPGDVDVATTDRLNALSESMSTDTYGVWIYRETGPADPSVWLVPLLAAVAVLVLGASAVALGLARFERRPDDATLAAVGGTPGLRRRIGLWQGLVIAGFGTFAGATAGILPPIGFWLQSQTSFEPMSLADIPWWLLAALAVALPVGIAAVNWLVPPREPELTRRNVIA
ncbi:FtsX-like permease family protein [Microbacterium sp. NPDC091382]|uniref:ABC transporter permease n=1 Tax=Microbacterium sp. NPDC091382 TaxID=3364210 RepID=UPI003802BFDA